LIRDAQFGRPDFRLLVHANRGGEAAVTVNNGSTLVIIGMRL